jgi:hypothetical protein
MNNTLHIPWAKGLAAALLILVGGLVGSGIQYQVHKNDVCNFTQHNYKVALRVDKQTVEDTANYRREYEQAHGRQNWAAADAAGYPGPSLTEVSIWAGEVGRACNFTSEDLAQFTNEYKTTEEYTD